MAGSGPVLSFVQVPPDLRPAVQTAFSRVWAGRIESWDGVSEPILAVVAGREAGPCWDAARRLEEKLPWVPVLAVVEGARGLRAQRGLPRNVAWAVWTDELEPGTLGLAMRYALEHGLRRRLERQLEDSRPLADMGWVASAVSHEIGNPLTSLLTNLELVQAQLVAAVDRAEVVDHESALAAVRDAHDGARHISRIAQDLGRASRRGGRIATVEVRSVLETARRLAAELLDGVEVRMRSRRCRPVRVDETRLCQVFLNLLKNSALALVGTASPRIELSIQPAGEQVVIRFQDNGPGIPPEVAPSLFRSGFTTRAEGSGLGLALSRRYVEAMGGTLVLDTSAAGGACFQITLPGAQQTSVSRPTLVPDRTQVSVDILVVDDTPLVRRAIQRVLEPSHHVVTAPDVDTALEVLAKERFDIVFLDLHMPGRSGIDLYEELCERFPGRARKVVFLSGAFSKDDLAYLDQRNLPWVRKPVGADELRDLVTELTTSRA